MRQFIRAAAKPLIFAALGSPPLVAAKLRAMRAADVLTILNLHRVGPPDGSTYPPLAPALFDYLLSFVRRHFDVVTFGDLPSSRPAERPKLILSFDDGYADFADFAVPLLEKHGLRANLNIVPECIETGLPPLNVAVQDYAGRAPLEELRRLEVPGFTADPAVMSRAAFGHRLGTFIANLPFATRTSLATTLVPQIRRLKGFAPTPMLGLEALRRVAEWHELGAHSFSHASMGLETDEYLADDVRSCKRWFQDELGRPVHVYAFPNGSFRPGQVELVQQASIEQVLLVGEDYSRRGSNVHKRFTFDARSRAEVRFKATGGLRRPRRLS